jgi:ABC-type transport system involved in multi-copper enzyme maturation permease subunit
MDPVGREFIYEAGLSWSYTGMWMKPITGQTLTPTTVQTTNNWMARFEVVDWTVISRYVISFLCIILAYNAVSGEREQGTLQLVLANPVSRASFLLGKFLAHWLTVISSSIIGALISLVILALSGVLTIDGGVLLGVTAWLALLCALFLLLGMGISSLSNSSATSLIFLVTAWTVVVVVVPQTSYLIAARTVEPMGLYWEAMGEHRTKMNRTLRLEGIQPRAREVGATDGFVLEKEYAQRLGQLEGMRRDLNERIFRQFEVARSVNLISPGYAFQYALEGLLGAGLPNIRAFFADAWRYREDLRQFLRAADAEDPDSPHVPFLPGYMSDKPVAADRFPRYQSQPISLADGFVSASMPLAILLLETALAFVFALWAVRRTDLTAD